MIDVLTDVEEWLPVELLQCLILQFEEDVADIRLSWVTTLRLRGQIYYRVDKEQLEGEALTAHSLH